jgi:hypothetical protein
VRSAPALAPARNLQMKDQKELLSRAEPSLRPRRRCERILRTPCPPGYVGVLRAVMLLWRSNPSPDPSVYTEPDAISTLTR